MPSSKTSADYSRGDTKAALQRIKHFAHKALADKKITSSMLAACSLGMMISPAHGTELLVAGTSLAIAHLLTKPVTHGLSKGIMQIGKDLKTGEEIWLDNDAVRQHMMVFGTVGASKTEALLGFAENSLAWSSGLLFCNASGDITIPAKAYALAKHFGREDDLLIVNLLTPDRAIRANESASLSNTYNPFDSLSAPALATMLSSFLSFNDVDSARWYNRSHHLLNAVIGAMHWLRSTGELEFNILTLRDHLTLKAISGLADPAKHPDMPKEFREDLTSYLNALPGYKAERGFRQPQVALDQHGYLELQFSKILNLFASTYAHIFSNNDSDVYMSDVVANRRILVVLLPDLEKAQPDQENLGKLFILGLKAVLGSILGSWDRKEREDILKDRPVRGKAPFMGIFDEVGTYLPAGVSLMAAQSRALDVGLIFGSLDLPAMKKNNEKEADSVIHNTNTKIVMRYEGIEHCPSAPEVMDILRNDSKISHQKLRQQKAGEMVVAHQETVIHGRVSYASATKEMPHHQPHYRGVPNHLVCLIPSPRRS